MNPTEGEHKYGDVSGLAIRFADLTNRKYAIPSIAPALSGLPGCTTAAARINDNVAKATAQKHDVSIDE